MPDIEMHLEYPPPRVVVSFPEGGVDRMSPDEALERADQLEHDFRESGQWFGDQLAFVSDMREKAQALKEQHDGD